MPGAGRVIAGSARGQRLLAPGPGTRPLSDRVKQSLFGALEAGRSGATGLEGATVLDLFAGSGAAGIEALSRGAAQAVFVERDPGAVRVIEANLARTGLGGRARVVRAEVVAWLTDVSDEGPFDVVIVDPPYTNRDLMARVLDRLGASAERLLGSDAVVVAKHFWRDRPRAAFGLLGSVGERRFGETALTFYRRVEPPQEGP